MSLNKVNFRTVVIVLMILVAAVLRVLGSGHVLGANTNFNPTGAIALFGGCYFRDKLKAYLVPLSILLLSDVVLMRVFFSSFSTGFLYRGWIWVYAAFALMVMIGHLIKRVNVGNVVLAAVAAAVVHWLVADFGSWLGGCTDITTGHLYPHDAQGLIKCYILAIPYTEKMLIGNLIYSALLFGGFELLQRRYPRLQSTIQPI